MENDIHKSKQIAYRADIDGLRAVAIIAVILFHTGFALFANGFIGVDIFFVISGYLITSITIREINKGKFTFTQFYTRRVKRLLPALFTMIIVVLTLGSFYLVPVDFNHLAMSSIYTIFYISNIYFSHLTGYFMPSVISLPLIHTWTLGVEEQYYLFYPAFLVVISLFLKKKYTIWVLFAGIVSFVLQLLFMHFGHPNIAFYYFPTRAWEFMMGGLLAFGMFPQIQSKTLSIVLAVLGMVFILYPMVAHVNSSEISSIMACIGSVLIIYPNTSSDNAIKKVLSTKSFVFVGLLSYSLYLWHWPILSIYREVSVLLPAKTDVILLISSFILIFVLSYISYRFIETPIIKMNFSANHKKLIVPVAAVMVLITSSSLYVLYNHGLPDRFPLYMQKVTQAPTDTYEFKSKYPNYLIKMDSNPNDIRWENFPTLGDRSARHTSYVVIGDSHAGSIAPAFDAIAKELHIKGKLFAQAANIPLLGVDIYGRIGSCWDKNDNFSKIKNHLMLLIRQRPAIKKIFLVARWTEYIHAPDFMLSDKNLDNSGNSYTKYCKEGRLGRGRTNKLFMQPNRIFDRTTLRVYQEGIYETLKTITEMNKQVYIVYDVPRINLNPQEIFLKDLLARYFKLKTNKNAAPDLKQYNEREKAISALFFNAHKKYNFKFLNPSQALCPDNRPCRVVDNTGYPIYVDNDHLSIHGALYIASQMKSTFIKALSMPDK